MKTRIQRVFLCAMLFAVLFFFTGCKEKNPYVGTWYNASDLSEMIIMTEDKTFSDSGMGGNYSYTDDRIIFNYGSWGTTVVEVSKENDETCLIQDNGHKWFKGYESARNYANKQLSTLYTRVFDGLPGRYASVYYDPNKVSFVIRHYLQLNDDGTYEYVFDSAYGNERSEDWQCGRWELNTNTYEYDRTYFELKLTAEETKFVDYKIKGNVEESTYNWENVLPKNLTKLYAGLSDDGREVFIHTSNGYDRYYKE